MAEVPPTSPIVLDPKPNIPNKPLKTPETTLVQEAFVELNTVSVLIPRCDVHTRRYYILETRQCEDQTATRRSLCEFSNQNDAELAIARKTPLKFTAWTVFP